jgi:hypothetical protein
MIKLFSRFLLWKLFIPNAENKFIFERIKASKIEHRKWHSIGLILRQLRFSIYRQLSPGSKMNLFSAFSISTHLLRILFLFGLPILFAAPVNQQECKNFVKSELSGISGWCSAKKAEAMMDLIFTTLPEVCVEMGVFGGASLFPTAYALKFVNHGLVYGVDAWDPNEAIRYYPANSVNREWWQKQNFNAQYQNCLRMINKYDLNFFFKIIKNSFAKALDQIPHIDILHIDATHTNTGDYIDAIPYIRKVKKMGYIWFDGWSNSSDTYEYFKPICSIEKVVDSGNCILLQKLTEE